LARVNKTLKKALKIIRLLEALGSVDMAGINLETPEDIDRLYTSTLLGILDIYESHCLESAEEGREPNRRFFSILYLGLVELIKQEYIKIGKDPPDDVIGFGNAVRKFVNYELRG
jgi:hypothetical protein